MLYAHLTIQASRIGDVVALGSLGVPPAVKYPHILLCRPFSPSMRCPHGNLLVITIQPLHKWERCQLMAG